jgi:cytochrome bd-type quinol oxidase subunit 2
MTIVAVIFVPIVIVYQFLVFRFFRAKVTRTQVAEDAEGY